MTWHILYVCLLHWLWCLGSKLLSGGQSSWLWNMVGQQGVENWLKWPPSDARRDTSGAGSDLQVAIWALPSALPQDAACLWERRREQALLYITAKVCLHGNIPLVLSSACVKLWGLVPCAGGSFVYVSAVVRLSGCTFNMYRAPWHLTQAGLRGRLKKRRWANVKWGIIRLLSHDDNKVLKSPYFKLAGRKLRLLWWKIMIVSCRKILHEINAGMKVTHHSWHYSLKNVV